MHDVLLMATRVAGKKVIVEITDSGTGTDAATQAEQTLKNLRTVLETAGSGLDQVVRCTVYLTSMDDFAAVNEVYARFFTASHPSRSCVEVSRLPVGALVEIDAVARIAG